MSHKVNTLTFAGVDIIDVSVQAHLAPGKTSFVVVGLPDKIIAESRERVQAALNSIGVYFPPKKITINLAPADLIKEGSHFDLAIASALMISLGILPAEELYNYLILGELALDGSLTSVAGVLPAAIGANMRNMGIICPEINGKEAAWSANKAIIAAPSLMSMINHFKGLQILPTPIADEIIENQNYPDLSDIKGLDIAKRALEIAAAGNHNIIMSGSPGAGKSMLASRMSGILPKMSAREVLECSMIESVAGKLLDGNLKYQRPFRAPHHSCSVAAMVGGGMGRRVSPGEISRAHNGVLFLDELPEFPRTVLDSLRQPLENGSILISRANYNVTYPAKFQLIAAMNPCRCGYIEDADRACSKAPNCASEYQAKISGPILDRIDIHLEIPKITPKERSILPSAIETSQIVAERVLNIRNLQMARYKDYGIRTNSELEGKLLHQFATPSKKALELLNEAAEKMRLSMRGYNRVLRVARTIADSMGSADIEQHHIAESLSYRLMSFRRFNR